MLCGIGVQKRLEYLDGRNPKLRALQPHVYADTEVLRKPDFAWGDRKGLPLQLGMTGFSPDTTGVLR
ncbi:MAG TPA: hypothetical protein ENL07_09645 [Chlorobaculum parvum]|uniref:Uncharacterized protein n=1 Tax=Chlorobaculum parvum TaxID=274539 RepID=A0A7C5HNR4_9CHLB|nr:hypothetical protein [Chlorobaculum parvum]